MSRDFGKKLLQNSRGSPSFYCGSVEHNPAEEEQCEWTKSTKSEMALDALFLRARLYLIQG